MAVPWATFFAPPNAISGFTSGAVADIDEWPFAQADNAYVEDAASGVSTPVLSFDLSDAPGDKKGFVLWLGLYVDNAAGYSIDEIRVLNGVTTLLTDSSPVLAPLASTSITNTSQTVYLYVINDSAWATDPVLTNINVQIDVTNLHGSTNRLRVSGARLSKSPFTAAQEEDLPSSLTGQTFSAFRASDLYLLGGEDDEEVVVWPDASGRGMHLVRWQSTNTPANMHSDDGNYVDFPEGSGTAFIGAFGTVVTGNHIHHARAMFYSGGGGGTNSRVIYSQPRTTAMTVTGAPGDKNILALDDDGSGDQWVIMSGDGSGGAHFHGGAISLDTWYQPTQWVQDSGNEHLWIDDDVSPIIDAASGANNLTAYGVGTREDYNSARHMEGRISHLRFVDGASVTEGEIDTARGEWLIALAYEQEGFRWRNDDGDEDGATWIASQDVDIETQVEITTRLRVLVDSSGGEPGSAAATLQYKRSDEPDSEWRTI